MQEELKVKIGRKCFIECTLDGQRKKTFELEVIDYQPGDEAGIKDVTFEIKGDYSFGMTKAEAEYIEW